MSALPDYRMIADLIKRGLTIEAQEKIMELREAAVTLKEENTSLRERLAEMEARGDVLARLVWEPPYYWLRDEEKRDGPYCQHCWDSQHKLIRLQRHGKGCWRCLACKCTVFDKDYVPPKPRVSRGIPM